MPTLFTIYASMTDYVAPNFVPSDGMHVHFDLNIEPGQLLRLLGSSPELITFQRAVGYIRSDGRMYDTPAVSAAPFDLDDPGTVGVRLLANDPDLNLDPGVSYQVRFERIWQGRKEFISSFYTPVVPSVDTAVNLESFAPGPGLAVAGVPEIGLVDDLADAGTAGKAVVRSSTGADVWATLGTVPSERLPSYIDDVLEFANQAAFPATGETGKIYTDLSTNDTFRWGGSVYTRISDRITASGITDSTATGRSLITAADAAAARSAIGAGTSNLSLGATSDTAKAGSYQPASTDITDATATGRAVLTSASATAARTTLDSLRNRPGWYDIRDWGADPSYSGSTNRVAINNALIAAQSTGAGGTLYFPQGLWNIAESGTGISYINMDYGRGNNIIFQGAGSGNPFSATGTGGTTIKGQTGNGPIIRWRDNWGFHMRDMRIVGTKGSGATTAQNGFQMDKTDNPTVTYITLTNVTIMNCGGSGLYANSLVAFNLHNVACNGNGVHGFYLYGGDLGTFSGCWAGANTQSGWYLDSVGYINFSSCGSDGNTEYGWYLTGCNATSFQGIGSESNTLDAMVIEGSWGITINGLGMYNNNRYGLVVRNGSGTTRSVVVHGIRETAKSGGGATYSIFTQGTTQPVTIGNYVAQTATNIHPTDTVMSNGLIQTKAVNVVGLNNQTGTTYTVTAADAGMHVTLNNSSAVTVAVPTYASAGIPVGSRIKLSQLGAGQVTVSGAAGVTVNSMPGPKIIARYGVADLIQVATDTWLLTGNLTS